MAKSRQYIAGRGRSPVAGMRVDAGQLGPQTQMSSRVRVQDGRQKVGARQFIMRTGGRGDVTGTGVNPVRNVTIQPRVRRPKTRTVQPNPNRRTFILGARRSGSNTVGGGESG